MGSTASVPIAFADSPSAAASAAPPSSTTPETDRSPSDKQPPLTPFSAKIAEISKSSLAVDKEVAAPPKSTAEPESQSWWSSWFGSDSPVPDIPNPGAYDELSQEATLILRPNLIEGLSFNFNAPLSEAFSLGSSVDMGSKERPSLFAFNANYYTNKLVMISRSTPSNGRVNARVFVNHTPALTTKLVADVGPEPDSSRISCDFDYRATRSSSQLKLASGRILALSHLHGITPTISVGGEAFLQARAGFSAVTLAAKYKDASRSASLSLATFGPVIVSYVRNVNPKVSFATELFVDARTRESHVTLGYRFDLSTSTVIGHVDSTGKVAATLEERINPALTLTLSGELDHAKESHNFGFGVNIGGG